MAQESVKRLHKYLRANAKACFFKEAQMRFSALMFILDVKTPNYLIQKHEIFYSKPPKI